MSDIAKKRAFSLSIGRLYTDGVHDAFDMIHFREPDESGDGAAALEYPENWSAEAATALFEEAAGHPVPAATRAIEENTVPSWLWRHAGEGKPRIAETGARQIFRRVAGAAAYAGWKLDAFADENEARIFFDEARWLLAQRFIAIEPRALASLGLDWAYGLARRPAKASAPAPTTKTLETGAAGDAVIRNADIDTILSGRDAHLRATWRRFLETGLKRGSLSLHFADIAADWAPAETKARPVRATIDLLRFRGEDGRLDVERLRHATRVLATLLDLGASAGDESGFIVGFCNLSPLLLALALPYDSDAARATAAAIAAVVTAETYAASARLASLLSPAPAFVANREGLLRALRNHRRAAYGDRNDYEKISVLPTPLAIDSGVDLALVAAARRGWDEALDLARQHGLRRVETELFASPSLAFFMESAVQGSEPLPSLITLAATEAGTYRRTIHPSVGEALEKLGYDEDSRQAIIAHIAGRGTLIAAPGIDPAALRTRGFDEAAIARVEDYLPYAGDLRLAITPWIVGEEFCRGVLKIPAAKLRDPRFDLLRHLGFSAGTVDAANAFCFGHNSAKSAPRLKLEHACIFAEAHEVPGAAPIRMAAAMQGFIAGSADLHLARPAGLTVEECENLALNAWRQGVKSIAITVEPRDGAQKPSTLSPRATLPATDKAPHAVLTGGPRLRSALKSRVKASGKLVGLKRGTGKTHETTGKKS